MISQRLARYLLFSHINEPGSNCLAKGNKSNKMNIVKQVVGVYKITSTWGRQAIRRSDKEYWSKRLRVDLIISRAVRLLDLHSSWIYFSKSGKYFCENRAWRKKKNLRHQLMCNSHPSFWHFFGSYILCLLSFSFLFLNPPFGLLGLFKKSVSLSASFAIELGILSRVSNSNRKRLRVCNLVIITLALYGRLQRAYRIMLICLYVICNFSKTVREFA